MSIAEQLKDVIGNYKSKSDEAKFSKQMEDFYSFKQKLEDAGLYKDEKYEIPLMNRLGHSLCKHSNYRNSFN